MNKKRRARITITWDYEIDPKHYPGCESDEDRLNLDVETYSSNIDHVIETLGTSYFDISGEFLS